MTPVSAPGAPPLRAGASARAEAGARRVPPPERWALPVAWALSALWMLAYLRRGWVPHDEGTLAQSAARVLAGELPHRDFVDLYTGALSYLNALAFLLFGESLLAPRIVLLLFALAWVPAVFAVARRFAPPLGAAALTLAAVGWSFPGYFAALPSWYNLVFATFGLLALLKAGESGRARWWAAAGACAGASVLFKVSGMFFLAAGLVAVAYAEQGDAARPGEAPGRPLVYRAFLAACALGLPVALRGLVGGGSGVFHLVLPAASLSALLLWNERFAAGRPSAARFRGLFGRALPYLAGAAVPVALFALPFVIAGALDDLVHGVFVLPARRISQAATPTPMVIPTLKAAAIPVLVLALGCRVPLRPLVAGAAALLGAVLLMRVPGDPTFYARVWLAARAALPLGVAAGAVALAAARGRVAPERRAAVFSVLAAAALCALVQFPFGAPVYFTYVAPLALLAVAAALSLVPERADGARRPLPALVLAFVLAFSALWISPGYIYSMGFAFRPHGQTTPLAGPRGGGLRVPEKDAREYARVVELLRRHGRGAVYAGPDAPEVYFLADAPNPTRQLFEFFDDPAGHDARLLAALDAAGTRAVALNATPSFSARISPALLAALVARYPRAEVVGRFMVRWRE